MFLIVFSRSAQHGANCLLSYLLFCDRCSSATMLNFRTAINRIAKCVNPNMYRMSNEEWLGVSASTVPSATGEILFGSILFNFV